MIIEFDNIYQITIHHSELVTVVKDSDYHPNLHFIYEKTARLIWNIIWVDLRNNVENQMRERLFKNDNRI